MAQRQAVGINRSFCRDVTRSRTAAAQQLVRGQMDEARE